MCLFEFYLTGRKVLNPIRFQASNNTICYPTMVFDVDYLALSSRRSDIGQDLVGERLESTMIRDSSCGFAAAGVGAGPWQFQSGEGLEGIISKSWLSLSFLHKLSKSDHRLQV